MPEPTMIQQIPNKEQIGAIINLCVDGALNMLLGESSEDRRKEMHEQHDQMLAIIDNHPVPEIRPYMSPREQIIQDTHDSNEHIQQAMTELEKAQKLAKCSVCKETLGQTRHFVAEKTQEILDASQKVLMMQRLKDANELPPDAHWEDLNKNQKKMVETLVEQFRPEKPVDYFSEDPSELRAAEIKRKTQQKRRAQKPKSKSRRK